MIMKDPIVEEVRKAREKHAQEFNNDLHAICKDLKEKQNNCGHQVVHYPPKKYLKATGT